MFVALVTLYSPLAALPSYMPIVGEFTHAEQVRLAFGLFVYASIFVVAGLWAGELLLEVLGISTAALTATGGIALLYEAVPLMRGVHETPTEVGRESPEGSLDTAASATKRSVRSVRSVLLTPVAFPLTVGGATFGVLVGFAATVDNVGDRFILTGAGLGYAAVTGITLYLRRCPRRRRWHSRRHELPTRPCVDGPFGRSGMEEDDVGYGAIVLTAPTTRSL